MNDATIERYLREDEDEAQAREKKYIGKSPWALAVARLGRNKLAMVCLAVIFAYVVTAIATNFDIFGLQKAATYFDEKTIDNRYLNIGAEGHPFGTDSYGRDVLARCILGVKVSLFLAFVAGLLTVPIAVIVGSVAGYYGGWLDEAAQYLMSIIVAIPGMLIIMSLIAIIGKSYFTIAFAFAVTGWVGLARVIRGNFIQAREFEYVLAARALGASDARIIFKHILPNVFHFVIVSFVLHFVSVIKSEVFLAYVGLSMVGVPTWGSMIDTSRNEVINGQWQNLLGPTLFMFVFLTCLNIFGDALRDALDPKLRNL
jgi:ABC-type dipeptide/oligopeptide/nickel transport system permease subunit